MDSFHARITPGEAQCIWQSADTAGLLNRETNAVIVHDMQRMRRRIGSLVDAFPECTLHALAIKANPVIEILRAAVDCGAGLEAASVEELHLALATDCPPERIVFDSPAKTIVELDEALSLGVNINVDNFDELSRIAAIVTQPNPKSTIGLRINSEVGAGAIATTSVAGRGSKFGVSISSDRQQIIDAFCRHPWLAGLHTHVGSQGCGLDLLCEAAVRLQALVKEIESSAGRPISVVNIGGGLPAAYKEDDEPPTPQAYADRLAQQASELMTSPARIVTEFGRAVQAGCGIALSRVEYVRNQNAGQPMAVIHLGADFLLRPVYRPSEWAHEFLLFDSAGKLKTGVSESVTIAGPLCFAGDIIARDIQMPAPAPGDWIAIRDCGAYTLSMWSRHCNRGIPAVLGYEADDETMKVLRRAELPKDIVEFWS